MPSIGGLFSCGYDVLVFVDESDAGPLQGDGSRFVLGRAVTFTERREVDRLSSLLEEEQAESWHASRRRAPSLFRSKRFPEIVERMNELSTSMIFGLRRTPSQLDAERDNYGEWLQNDRANWPSATSATPECILLFAYLQRVRLHIAWRQTRRDLPGSRSLVACDQQSWWQNRGSTWYRDVALPPEATPYPCEARALVDKSRPEAWHVLRWINLVDSELWAFCRLLRHTMPDGRRLDEHLKERAGDLPLPTSVLDEFRESHPNALRYLESVIVRMSERGRYVFVDAEPWQTDVEGGSDAEAG